MKLNIQINTLIKFTIVWKIRANINKAIIKSFTKNSDGIYKDCLNGV